MLGSTKIEEYMNYKEMYFERHKFNEIPKRQNSPTTNYMIYSFTMISGTFLYTLNITSQCEFTNVSLVFFTVSYSL